MHGVYVKIQSSNYIARHGEWGSEHAEFSGIKGKTLSLCLIEHKIVKAYGGVNV
jgi:hypothetical protein